jgi:ketosteroid isomerase-like protein
MEIWELVARESIRDIVARYNCNGDSGRIGAMMSLFTPDAVLEVPGRDPQVGRDAICHFFTVVAKPDDTTFVPKSLHHHTATHQIDIVDKRSAKGRCYFAVLTQGGLDHWGRYVDEYRYHDGQWKIQNRKVYVDGLTPGGWGEKRLEHENIGTGG